MRWKKVARKGSCDCRLMEQWSTTLQIPSFQHFSTSDHHVAVPPDQRNLLAVSAIPAYHTLDDQQYRPAPALEPVSPVNILVPPHACLPHWWQLASAR